MGFFSKLFRKLFGPAECPKCYGGNLEFQPESKEVIERTGREGKYKICSSCHPTGRLPA